MSADAQKIITDVFSLKFSDLNNPNTKQAQNFNDTIVPETLFVKLGNGEQVPVTLQVAVLADKPATVDAHVSGDKRDHIPGPPNVATHDNGFTEHVDVTASPTIDTISGTVNYADINPGDIPTVKTQFNSFTYKDRQGNDVPATHLTVAQLAAIVAVEVPLDVVQDPNLKNTGAATWTYNVPDGAFDFLAIGETLTLTYTARVDNNFAPNNETTFKTFTITITGTNDAPVIATSGGAITERIGTGNTAIDTASGTVTFADVDLTDRPVVSTSFSSFHYFDAQGHEVTGLLTDDQKAAIAAVKIPLSVVQAAGNTHNGSATWTYSISDKAFDFIAKGERLTLVYVAQVDDGHGGVVSTPISVSINGTDVEVIGTNDVPTIAVTSNSFVEQSNPEQPNPTGSAVPDTVAGTISFTDADLTDRPVASAAFTSYTYTDTSNHALTLTAQNLANVSAPLTVVQTPGNTNDGSASWTYSVADGAFDFLAADEVLTLTYTATVDDGHGGVITKPFTVTITGTNDTPVFTSSPQIGAVAERANTHNSQTPDTASGTMTFTDPDLTDTHDVTITDVVASGVKTGLADHDTQLGWLSLDALNNSIGGVTGSENWTFSASDQYFDYLADGETVKLTYTVKVDDHHGGVTTQDVAVTVTGANDAPEVSADVSGVAGVHAITERAGVTGNSTDPDVAAGSLAFRDVDLSDTHTVSASKPAFAWFDRDGQPKSLTLQDALEAASTLTLTPHDSTGTGHGSVDFNYSAADNSFDFLADGETLTITYDITVTDEHSVSSTKPVTITVTGTNDAPVAVADTDNGHIVESGDDAHNNVVSGVATTTGNVLGNDTDVDLTDSHTVVGVVKGVVTGDLTGSGQVGAVVAGMYGLLVLKADGSWTYTLDNDNPLTNALAQGVHVSDVFSYTESDHHGGTSTTTLTIGITGTNDKPVANAAPFATTDVNAGAPVVEQGVNPGNTAFAGVDHAAGNVLSNDLDVDTGDTKTVQGVASGAATGPLTDHVATSVHGTYGSVTIGVDGSWTYALDNDSAATQALKQGEQVSDVFTYTMRDTLGSTSSATLTIDVTGTNDAPTLAPKNAGTLTDTAEKDSFGNLTGTLDGHDVDSGETASLSYAVIDSTSHLATSVAVGKYGSLTMNANGAYIYVADASAINALQTGTYHDSFTVQTTDVHGATATATLTVDVTGANDTPSIVGETDPLMQAVMVVKSSSPIVLAEGVNDNLLGLSTETFDGREVGHDNFDNTLLGAHFSASGAAGVVHGSSSVTAAPFVGPLPGHQDTTNYLSIGGGGSETITFASEKNTFGLYWGSVDAYNTIKFYDGANLVATYTGADIAPLFASGNQGSFSSNGYVEFSGLTPFDKVVLSSTSNAFEIDNISAGTIHSQLAAPVSGTLSVLDLDIGDTLTASVTGNATVAFKGADGSTHLPNGTNIAALIDAHDVTFDTVQSDGGTEILHWTYHPTNPNLDFLQAGDELKIQFTAQVDDGHGHVGSQPLTVTLVGANNATNISTFSVVNGTTGNDTFSNVGGNTTIFGGGGHDTFVFNPNFGTATIADFHVNDDTINFSQGMFANISVILASAQPANSNLDTIITDAHQDTILLKGITAGLLQASNFHIV